MAIESLDTLIESMSGGIDIPYQKYLPETSTHGYNDLFFQSGNPKKGSTPPLYSAGSGYTLNNQSPGAISLPSVTAGKSLYLMKNSTINFGYGGFFQIYDRLWACSGIPTNGSGQQTYTINTPGVLPRYATEGAELWIELYYYCGWDNATWTVSYTNQDGTAGRTATYHYSNADDVREKNYHMEKLQLQSGDTGVRSVQSVTTSNSTSFQGDFGVVIAKTITEIGWGGQWLSNNMDFAVLNLPEIHPEACVSILYNTAVNYSGHVFAYLKLGQG